MDTIIYHNEMPVGDRIHKAFELLWVQKFCKECKIPVQTTINGCALYLKVMGYKMSVEHRGLGGQVWTFRKGDEDE